MNWIDTGSLQVMGSDITGIWPSEYINRQTLDSTN
jgi:hypothetical protein